MNVFYIYGSRPPHAVFHSTDFYFGEENSLFPPFPLSPLTHRSAPSYLSQLVRVADLPGRRSLRSVRTNRLLVPSVKLSTVGGRAFPVAGPTICNSLPDNVISAPSLSTFLQRLKHFSSTPRSMTLLLIPGKLFPTSSGS